MLDRIIRVVALGVALIAAATTCRGSAEPDGSERWVADLTSTQQVLFMTFRTRGSEVTGMGTLSSLTSPGGEPLILTGTRSADSLRITFRRQIADPFRLTGRYIGPGIAGVLDGAEFVQLAVAFRTR